MKKFFTTLVIMGITLFAQEQSIKNFDFSKAIKMGNGKQIVVEFSDPECPGCRKSEKIISKYDVTRYIILSPLVCHTNAKKLSIHILCSANPQEEYTKVMNGDLDDKELTYCEAGEKHYNSLLKIMEYFNATEVAPVFIINNERMEGFNKNTFETLLNK